MKYEIKNIFFDRAYMSCSGCRGRCCCFRGLEISKVVELGLFIQVPGEREMQGDVSLSFFEELVTLF